MAEKSKAFEDLAGIGCLLQAFGIAVLAPLSRYFHRTGGLDGPIGVVVAIALAAILVVAIVFVLGWAFRKGWKAADKS